jgi:hypothetical protein
MGLSVLALLVQLQTAEAAAAALDSAVLSVRGYDFRREPPLAADEAFYRRLVLDLHGRPADDAEVAAFKAEADPRKHVHAVERLTDDPRFAKRWARRLGELLLGDLDRVSFERVPGVLPELSPVAVGNFVAWLERGIEKDRPWTDTVRELLEVRGNLEEQPALVFPLSMHRGRGAEVEFPEAMARRLLGIRLQCARCHDHPYDKWRVEDYWGLAAFRARQVVRVADLGKSVRLDYSDQGEQLIPGLDSRAGALVNPAKAETAKPVFLFGGTLTGPHDDRMKVLANLMTAKANTQLPRALANRAWGWLLREAIVSPADDFNLRNKALSPALLDALQRSFAENGSSIRFLVRTICLTKAYRLATPEEAPGEYSSFRHLARAARGTGLYRPPRKDEPAPPVRFEAPEAWTRWAASGPVPLWTLQDKEGKAADAELRIYKRRANESDLEAWSNRFGGAKFRKEDLAGQLPGVLHEVAGTYGCDRRADVPYEGRLLLVALRGAKDPWLFELIGPAETVDDWRKDFLDRVLQATEKP